MCLDHRAYVLYASTGSELPKTVNSVQLLELLAPLFLLGVRVNGETKGQGFEGRYQGAIARVAKAK